MKIATLLGTRPELIRLSRIIPKLDKYCEHCFVYTGQNYTKQLKNVFFEELEIRKPDVDFQIQEHSPGAQIGKILTKTEELLKKEGPDKLLLLGDTNSGMAALIAKRMQIPVYHMEAGNRCYDDHVPEEVNRRVIDHCSSILMPYTYRSKENLVREGIERERIFVIGNPIKEVLDYYQPQIEKNSALKQYGLKENNYFLVTIHRAETVDQESDLAGLLNALKLLKKTFDLPVICSFHPRTQDKVEKFGIDIKKTGAVFLEPLSFFEFIKLERNAFCVATDSGTVQEECCLFHVPSVTLRKVTERPETIECGSNILTGLDPETILQTVKLTKEEEQKWNPPAEYLEKNVSAKVVKILLGFSAS